MINPRNMESSSGTRIYAVFTGAVPAARRQTDAVETFSEGLSMSQ